MTYVEAKFGLRILDSRPSDTVTRGHFDPMDFDTVNSLSSGKGKGHRVYETVASSAVERIFNVTAMHAKATASNHLARANRASHGQRVRAKDIVQKVMENPKKNPKVTMVPKVRTRVKTSKKKGLQGLEHPKSETSSETLESAQTYPTDTSYMDNSWCDGGWSHDE